MNVRRLAMRHRSRLGNLLVVALPLAGGCGASIAAGLPASPPHAAISIEEEDASRCIRSESGAGNPFRGELPAAEEDPALLPYLEPLSADVRRTAVAAGLEPLLARYLRALAVAHGEPTLEVLTMRQEVAERIATLQPQMLSTEFECECVAALLTHAIEEHEESAGRRQQAMTVASLVAGAGFSLAAGAWDLANGHIDRPRSPDGPLITAIAGAAATTGLGAVAMVPRRRPLLIEHAHNLLEPIVRGSDPEGLYPTFIFRMLTMPTVDGEPIPRDQLVSTWERMLEEAVPASDRATAEAILFGEGGVYDDDLARLRRAMLAELETTLDSLARHVDRLGGAIVEASEESRPPRD